MNEEYIRDYTTKKILGVIRETPTGDRTAFEFPSYKQLGIYRKSENVTYIIPSYKKISEGDSVVSLIYENANNKR